MATLINRVNAVHDETVVPVQTGQVYRTRYIGVGPGRGQGQTEAGNPRYSQETPLEPLQLRFKRNVSAQEAASTPRRQVRNGAIFKLPLEPPFDFSKPALIFPELDEILPELNVGGCSVGIGQGGLPSIDQRATILLKFASGLVLIHF